MTTARVTTRLLALPLACALATLGACGNDAEQGTTPPTPPPAQTGGGETAEPVAEQPANQDRGRRRELPRVKPLTAEKAKRILLRPLGELRDTEDVHAALKYLATLGDRSAVRPIREQLVDKQDGAYPLDGSGAAMGLHVLKLYNEEGLEREIVEVVKAEVADEFAGSFCVAALSTLKDTSRQKDAEGLLVRMLENGDGTDVEAATVLVEWRSEGARAAFAEILSDASKEGDLYVDDELIGAAVAGLLELEDERGVQFMEAMIADPDGDFSPDGIVEGMGIPGATKSVPYIKRLVEQEIAEDIGDSAYSATVAFSAIYQDGGGGEHVAFLERVLNELDEPYAGVALWVLGKEEYAGAVAEELKRTILNINNYDVSDAVYLLERIADRKAAGDPAFKDLVDVAAQVEATGGNPAAQASATARQRQLNAAAAYAFLATKK